jgi:hypothetical protein
VYILTCTLTYVSKGPGALQRRILQVLADGPANVHEITMSYHRDDEKPPPLRSIQRAMRRLWEDGRIEFAFQMERTYVYRLPGDERDMPDRRPNAVRRLAVERQYGDIVAQMVAEDEEALKKEVMEELIDRLIQEGWRPPPSV